MAENQVAPEAGETVAGQVETPVEKTDAKVAAEAADDSERTKEQFEKLLNSNKKLYQANELLRKELTQREAAQQQFASVQQPPAQQPAQQQVNPSDFVEVDPETGQRFINESKLQARIDELQQRASRAEESVQKYIQTSEEREIERQNREAFSVYPELNPADAGFDMIFHNQTRAAIYDSLINPQDYGGKSLNFKDAADFIKQTMGRQEQKSQPKTEPQGEVEGGENTDALKQQVAAEPQGESQQVRESGLGREEYEQIKNATRMGNTEALAARLSAIEHVQKVDAKQ